MRGPSHDSRTPLRWVRADPTVLAEFRTADLHHAETLGSRALGGVITDHRSSWVRLVTVDQNKVYVKTYDYPTTRDRWRGLMRTTALAASRATREWDALTWLRQRGFPAPRPLLAGEWRRLGLLRRAILVTSAWPGAPADALLGELGDGAARDAAIDAIVDLVARLHAAGFRDRNLDLRNLLVRASDGDTGYEVAKVDSPRHRIVRPGSKVDRWVREDRRRLSASFRALGLEPPASIG